MKYLKLFEDINTDGYELISATDIFNPTFANSNNVIDISKEEYNKLSPYIQKIDNYLRISLKNNFLDTKHSYIDANKNKLGVHLIICKLSDEWYHVFYHNYRKDITDDNYKCDQMYGLINCLKHLAIQ